jgi:hypothetical protein
VVHDGLNFPDGPEILLLCLLDEFERRLSKNLLAYEVLPALGVVAGEMLGDQFGAEVEIGAHRHVELMSHCDKFISEVRCAI